MEPTVDEALKKGVEAHKAGQLHAAQRLYAGILEHQPKHADANHNMGVLAVGVGKIQESLPFFKTATEANPGIVQFWLSYIDTLIKLGRLADAQVVFDQAKLKGVTSEVFDQLEKQITKERLKVNAINPLGSSTSKSNVLDTIKLDKALRLANRKSKDGGLEEAKLIYQDILHKFPNNKKALNALQSLTGVSIAVPQDPSSEEQQSIINLYTQGEFQQALFNANKMLHRFPNSSILYNISGASNAALMQFNAAVISYKRALKIEPNSPETYYNMGAALNDGGSVEAAVDSYKQALKIKPSYLEAYKNLGSLYHENRQYREARECFDKLTDRYSVAKALECTYFLENHDDFNERLASITKKNPSNIRVAAMSAFAAHQLKQKDSYPFCKNPHELITFGNIKNHITDSNQFINTLLDEMNQKKTAWEPKKHATISGFHTSGNLFSNPNGTLKILENIIQKELDSFYSKFKSHDSGLIQNWPKENNINAWYIRMLKNGHQRCHIHPAGCVSGVLYLKTVESPAKHEGAIEFGLHGYDYPVINEDYHRQIYQPCNGDIILFPSSLFHQTIPVIKDVERCVIAFDFLK